tara:strand:- start:283 stop:855 length:573 start_codon:yes stop_codon:yes gene_type:complete
MAQTSTTLLSAKSHIADLSSKTDISFSASGSIYKIASTTTSLAGFKARDLITITGSTSNNKTFTVKTGEVATEIVVEEIVTNENAGASVTLDHTGFVSDKKKGDGYYSKPDGVHTVSYSVGATLTGLIKMQGSLATTPTEDDWFDIGDTTFNTDQSTQVSSANFTGNFVWVRAKATSVTAGTINSVMLNN